MKQGIILLAVAGCCFFAFRSHADLKDATILWTGNSGYSAQITLSYDNAFSSVGAWGGGSSPLFATNQGILDLAVTFYNPSLQPIFSTNDISNGTISYRFLRISFNTQTYTLFGDFDVGKDSFAEGLPGSSAGQYYLTDFSVPSLHDSQLGQIIDSGGQFTVVPEPSVGSLYVAAIAVFAIFRLRTKWV